MLASCKDMSVSLVRVSICRDHRVKAQFSDNSILLLSSRGDRFIHCDKSGVRVNQLSEFAMGRYVGKLAQIVRFRNMHLDKPIHCSSLTRNKSGMVQEEFDLGYEINSVRWKTSTRGGLEFPEGGENEEGKVGIVSEDGLAQMLLHEGK